MRLPKLLGTSSFRLALMYAGLTGVTCLFLFGTIFWSTTRFMRHQIDDSVRNELNEIIANSAVSDAPDSMEVQVRGMARHASEFFYLLQNKDQVVLAGNLPSLDPQVGIREWQGEPNSIQKPYSAMRGRGEKVGDDYLFVGWSTYQLHEMEEFVVAAFGWGLVASVLLALGAGVVMSRRLMRKIETVSETSRNIIRGDLQQRVPVQRNGGDEFHQLALSINAMLDRIEALMDDVRQVTTDIAHDLRTPLTRLRNRLEYAQRSNAQGEELRDTLGAARRETDVILDIFGALLRISQVESGARKSGFARVDVSELIDTVLEIYGSAADERHQHIAHTVESGLEIHGDRELLIQMFANLLENAIRHSPSGARIEVEGRRREGAVQVSIADNGPGIPENMRAKVLQRFFRMENSRTTPGSGLGLSLAAAIAHLHEARLALTDNRPGLRVEVGF